MNRRRSALATVLALLVATAVALTLAVGGSSANGVSSGTGSREPAASLKKQVQTLKKQVKAAQNKATVGSVIAGIDHVSGAGFHAMDEALSGGQTNSRYLSTVQNVVIVVDAVSWPAAVQSALAPFRADLGDLVTALQGTDVSVMATAASAVHASQHGFANAVFDWLEG